MCCFSASIDDGGGKEAVEEPQANWEGEGVHVALLELEYKLPVMIDGEVFSTILVGLAAPIQEQVGTHIHENLRAKIRTVKRLNLFRTSCGKWR